MRLTTRQGFEAIRIERIEADRDPMEAGVEQRLRVFREQDPVGRQREVFDAGVLRQHSDQYRKVFAEQRLPARQSNFVHAQFCKQAREGVHFLEGQQRFARQPGVLFLGHAVVAT